MGLIYFTIFLSLSLLAENGPNIKAYKKNESEDNFEHEFKGCLENSKCDQVMGLQLTRWQDFLQELKKEQNQISKRYQELEKFREKNGIPIEFYTTEKSQQGFKPLLYHSPCKNHNPEKGQRIQRGISFVKSITGSKAIVWRDQTQIEVPLGEIFIPQTVSLFLGDTKIQYQIPIDDRPLFIKNNNLYLLKEDHEMFFVLEVSSLGNWKIVNVEMNQLPQWAEKISEASCPENSPRGPQEIFNTEICKSIWNEDLKKNIIIKIERGCSI